jgi:hypothetical protein
VAQAEPPGSRDELFGTATAAAATPSGEGKSSASPLSVRGFSQFEPAYTYASPSHWSRAVVRTQVEATKELSSSVKAKASFRVDVDPVYFNSDFYNQQVKDDQKAEFLIRETYVDLSAGDWELRLGRQQIIWGEVVGLFVADVVSARDQRDFILPEFDILRIPQWAVRAERFWKNAHLELVWVPYPSYDNIGKPGAEFYPLQPPVIPGFANVLLDDEQPARTLSNTNYGFRASTLHGGWDISAFYYASMSAAPTYYRQVATSPAPQIVYQPRHDQIWQVGGTATKDFRAFVLRGEAVYTHNKGYETTALSDPDGVIKQPALEYILGLEFLLPWDVRLNVQGYQRRFLDYDPNTLYDEVETSGTLLLSGKIGRHIEPQILVMEYFGMEGDRLVRPSVDWLFQPNARLRVGVDIFNGPPLGYFGRFDNRDRVYGELRYTF